MSRRRRARRARQQPWSGWIDDGRGAMHLVAGRQPTPPDLEALFALRDAVLARVAFEEREMGRWEDDGGRPPTDDVRRLHGVLQRLARGLS